MPSLYDGRRALGEHSLSSQLDNEPSWRLLDHSVGELEPHQFAKPDSFTYSQYRKSGIGLITLSFSHKLTKLTIGEHLYWSWFGNEAS